MGCLCFTSNDRKKPADDRYEKIKKPFKNVSHLQIINDSSQRLDFLTGRTCQDVMFDLGLSECRSSECVSWNVFATVLLPGETHVQRDADALTFLERSSHTKNVLTNVRNVKDADEFAKDVNVFLKDSSIFGNIVLNAMTVASEESREKDACKTIVLVFCDRCSSLEIRSANAERLTICNS